MAFWKQKLHHMIPLGYIDRQDYCVFLTIVINQAYLLLQLFAKVSLPSSVYRDKPRTGTSLKCNEIHVILYT